MKIESVGIIFIFEKIFKVNEAQRGWKNWKKARVWKEIIAA